MHTCNTAVQVHGVPRCAKIHYCTRTHATRFGNTTGLPIPVFNPTFDAPFHEELYDWLDHVIDIATSERRNQHVRIFLLFMLNTISHQSFYFYDSLLTLGL